MSLIAQKRVHKRKPRDPVKLDHSHPLVKGRAIESLMLLHEGAGYLTRDLVTGIDCAMDNDTGLPDWVAANDGPAVYIDGSTLDAHITLDGQILDETSTEGYTVLISFTELARHNINIGLWGLNNGGGSTTSNSLLFLRNDTSYGPFTHRCLRGTATTAYNVQPDTTNPNYSTSIPLNEQQFVIVTFDGVNNAAASSFEFWWNGNKFAGELSSATGSAAGSVLGTYDASTTDCLDGYLHHFAKWGEKLSDEECHRLTSDPDYIYSLAKRRPSYVFQPSAAGGTITGTGTLTATGAAIAGIGEIVKTGTATLQALGAAIAGVGERVITGTAALEAIGATISAVGTIARSGTGALQAIGAKISGTDSLVLGGRFIKNVTNKLLNRLIS